MHRVKFEKQLKTVLFDYCVPLSQWIPLVIKKFNIENSAQYTLYISGQAERTFCLQPLCIFPFISLFAPLCESSLTKKCFTILSLETGYSTVRSRGVARLCFVPTETSGFC